MQPGQLGIHCGVKLPHLYVKSVPPSSNRKLDTFPARNAWVAVTLELWQFVNQAIIFIMVASKLLGYACTRGSSMAPCTNSLYSIVFPKALCVCWMEETLDSCVYQCTETNSLNWRIQTHIRNTVDQNYSQTHNTTTSTILISRYTYYQKPHTCIYMYVSPIHYLVCAH
jgi:hypothetical protein